MDPTIKVNGMSTILHDIPKAYNNFSLSYLFNLLQSLPEAETTKDTTVNKSL